MQRLMILVAGPCTAPTAEERKANLDHLNRIATEVFRKGHIPMMGLNCALPVVGDHTTDQATHRAVMEISLVVADRCGAVLVAGSSKCADMEVEHDASDGRIGPHLAGRDQRVVVLKKRLRSRVASACQPRSQTKQGLHRSAKALRIRSITMI